MTTETASPGKGDRELLEVGKRAVAEYAAWKARNAARSALHAFFKTYTDETGERFDRGACLDGGMHEDVAAFDALSKPAMEAQRKLTTARSATRRAAASLATVIQGGEKV